MEIFNVDRNMMDLACQIASQSDCKFLHGAVITVKGRPISIAHNIDRRIPIDHRYRQEIRRCNCKEAQRRRARSESTHAETYAIIRAATDLSGATLYSARVTKTRFLPASSFPCPGCLEIIQIARIRTVVYFDQYGNICKERV